MMYDREKPGEAIPLYLNGSLTGAEAASLEEALKGSEHLQMELEEFKEIQGCYVDISEDIPQPDPGLYDKILRSIEVDERRAPEKQSTFKLFLDFMESLFRAPSLSWGVAGVQLAIIILLVTGAPQERKYETLSSPSATAEGKLTFKLVFHETAKEGEIRALMQELRGQLVSGPSTVGSYTIEIPFSELKAEEILERLRKSPVVGFAEKSF